MKESVNKAYKFRIYLTKEQEVFFAKHFGCVRFIYNFFLGMRKEVYQNSGESLTGLECKKIIPSLKKRQEYLWLNEINSQSLQQATIDLEMAYLRFFKKELKSGYPKFKKKSQDQSFCVPQNFKICPRNNFLWIPKLKTAIKVHFHRGLKKVVKFNSVTFSKTSSGKYFAAINVEEEIKHRAAVKKVSRRTKTVGIDLGLKDLLVESNGKKTSSPKFLRISEKKLKIAQKKLTRKVKGSCNRKKQRIIVARLHETIANQRLNFLHKESARLVRENQAIYLETLNVKGMIKNRKLSKSISDSGWGEFIRQLKYKCRWKGTILVQVGRWEPTSKLCSTNGCNYKNDVLKLVDREWFCPKCKTLHDRDTNAARNIEKIGREAPELTPVERSASVFSIKKIQAGSMKQESLAVS